MGYQLKILNDEEFNSLPFIGVEDSLGCANPKTGIAYVRKTGIRPLDAMVAEHELEELISNYSDHEGLDGIRHKKGRDIFAPIGTALLSLFNPAVGAVAAAGYQGYKVHKKEASPWSIPMAAGTAYFGGKAGQAGMQGFKSAAPGFMSKLAGTAKGVGSALGFGGGGTTAAGSLGAGAGAAASLANVGTQTGSVGGAGLLSSLGMLGNKSLGYGGGGGNISATTGLGQDKQIVKAATPQNVGTSTDVPTTDTSSGLLGKVGELAKNPLAKLGLGAAIPMLGGKFGPQAEEFDPRQSELFNQVLDRVQSGTQVELSEGQRQAITDNFDQELDVARDNLKQRFKALRPGSDVSNDSSFLEASRQMEQDFAERKSLAVTQAQLGLTQEQTSQLSQLASMDIFSLAQAAQISVDEANAFKQMLAELGVAVASPSPISLGGGGNSLAGLLGLS